MGTQRANAAYALAQALGGRGTHEQRRWLAHCPAHEDEAPSLALGEGGDGAVEAVCLAGCPHESVERALGPHTGARIVHPRRAQPAGRRDESAH